MKERPTPTDAAHVLRGQISDLQGSQDYILTSWARFTLGYQSVLMHGPFLAVPPLAEGDEVAVAGGFRRDGVFEASALHKYGEPAEEQARFATRGIRLRLAFWAILPGLIFVTLVVVTRADLLEHLKSLSLLAFAVLLFSVWPQWQQREAQWSLAVAVRDGTEQDAEGGT